MSPSLLLLLLACTPSAPPGEGPPSAHDTAASGPTGETGATDTGFTLPDAPTWQDDVEPLFAFRCMGCHGNGDAQGGFSMQAGLATMIDVPSEQSDLVRIRPGEPGASYLWHKLEGTQRDVGGLGQRMPVGRTPLDPADLALVERWILQGAAP